MDLTPLASNLAVNLTFTILTHNLWCHYLTHAPNKGHRMEYFIKTAGHQNYDVILLQELFVFNVLGMPMGDRLRQHVSDEFRKLGYVHQVTGIDPPYPLIFLIFYSFSFYKKSFWFIVIGLLDKPRVSSFSASTQSLLIRNTDGTALMISAQVSRYSFSLLCFSYSIRQEKDIKERWSKSMTRIFTSSMSTLMPIQHPHEEHS